MSVTLLPTPPSRSDPTNFPTRADAFLGALPQFAIDVNNTSMAINTSQTAAASSASASAASATSASTSSSNASTSATNAATSATNSANSATASANSASAAAASATAATTAQVVGTSSTSVTIQTGPATFVTQASKQFAVGVPIIAVDSSNAANYVYGMVSSYSSTSLVINVTNVGGSGSPSLWNISICGKTGIQGPGNAAGNAAGAINELKGSAPTSSATPDIWNAGGNYVPVTQTTTITGFPNAPQAGSKRTLQIGSAVIITNSANLYVHGGTTNLNVGDEVDIVADTISSFRATVRLAGGNSTYMNLREQYSSGTNGVSTTAASQFTTRTLNTTTTNSIVGASLSSNTIILPQGTYRIKARAPWSVAAGGSVNPVSHQLTFYNVTDSTYSIVGSSAVSAALASSDSFINGVVTITSSKTFTLSHFTGGAGTYPGRLGTPSSSGVGEVYAEIEIFKVA